MTHVIAISQSERKRTADVLESQAAHAPFSIGAKGYMRKLIGRTNWQQDWRLERRQGLTGDAELDAQELVDWSISQKTNSADERYTAVAGLLEDLMEDVGLEDRTWMAALIDARELYHDKDLSTKVKMRYLIPEGAKIGTTPGFGPDID